MTRDDIIQMAREADIDPHDMCEDPRIAEHSLERFFHMAQAAERESMIKQGWRQCAKGQRTTQFCGMVEQAVQAEREACAKMCETLWNFPENGMATEEECYGAQCADAIRARK